jgi:hypothetical protein
MAGTQNRTALTRERVPVTLDRDVLEWVAENSLPGGPFGGASHAVDRALGRLRVEYDFIHETCREKGSPFRPAAFWRLYAKELKESEPAPSGRPFKGEVRQGKKRPQIFVTVDTGLLSWAHKICIKPGPFATISQTIEAALRRLRSGEERLDPSAIEPKISETPETLWKHYKQALDASKTTAT